jgi:hypothetical protein
MRSTRLLSLTVVLAGLGVGAHVQAQTAHEHHAHHGMPSAGAAPPLRILFPQPGAKLGTQLAIVFETPGDMNKMTMSAPVVGTHLHIETDEVSVMPMADQLIPLGGGRYVFVFDLPVKPGEHWLRVYWADGTHKTIDASVQTVKVTVEAGAAASPP